MEYWVPILMYEAKQSMEEEEGRYYCQEDVANIVEDKNKVLYTQRAHSPNPIP